MTFTVRRVVTTHDADGSSVVEADALVESAPVLPGYASAHLWHTDEFPIDGAAPGHTPDESVPRGQRTVIRCGQLEPGHASPMHRSHTLDYAVLVDGRCELVLDGGDVVELLPGDVVVQRGTNHIWRNRGEVAARFVFVLMDARPVEVAGRVLRDTMPPEVGR